MLTEAEMKKILTQPKNALCKQYKHLLGAANTNFKITPEALREIAAAACKRNSGARGLRSILEQLLRDAMYEVRWGSSTANRGRSHPRACDPWFSSNLLVCLMQSPEPETKGVLLDAEGVTSKKGARIFTSVSEYQQALADAGVQDSVDAGEEDELPRAAVSGM